MKIENGDICIKRGEEAAIQVNVLADGEPYKMQFADRIRFVAKRSMIAGEAAVIDRAAIGRDVIRIRSSDTADLTPGKYRYEVLLEKSDGSTHIVIDPHNFVIGGSGI